MAGQIPENLSHNVRGSSSSSTPKPPAVCIPDSAPKSLINIIVKQAIEQNPIVLPDIFLGTKLLNISDYVDLTAKPLASKPTPETSFEVPASDIPSPTDNVNQNADVEMVKADSTDSEGMEEKLKNIQISSCLCTIKTEHRTFNSCFCEIKIEHITTSKILAQI